VLFCGRPLDIRTIADRARAVLVVWMPGTEGGRAIADVLSGAVSPSGKLPMSFPYSIGQVPIHYNEFNTGRPYVPGGFPMTSRYIDAPNAPLYPFGFGLTYGKFEISAADKDKGFIVKSDPSDAIHVSVTVKNAGQQAATETIQLYIRDLAASVVRPKRELKGFKKVTLASGAQSTVDFTITEDMLRFYTEHQVWESELGDFEAYVGSDSTTENVVKFRLK
jgi:beta-glucosidase